MKKLILLIFVINTFHLFAQNEIDEIIYRGYLKADLKKLAAPLDKVAFKDLIKSQDTDELYQYLELSYVLLSSTLTYEDEVTFSKYVDNTVELAERILEVDKEHAKAMSILSGVYGLKIAYSPMKGMFIGPKSTRYAEKSYETAPSDPTTLMMYGINKYNTPGAWGGDIDKAIEVFKAAISYYEEKEKTSNNWKYLNSLAWLGLAYEEKKEYGLAESAYNKSIETEPDFEWGIHLLEAIGD